MSFPFSIIGTVVLKKGKNEVPIDDLVDAIRDGLRKVKASKIIINRSERKISFSGGFFRFVTNWNILHAVSNGEIRVEEANQKISLHYNLKFTEMLILVTILVFGVFGDFNLQGSYLSFFPKILNLAILWFLFFGMNYLVTMIRFPPFIRRIIGML
jgi:hypothetical protein